MDAIEKGKQLGEKKMKTARMHLAMLATLAMLTPAGAQESEIMPLEQVAPVEAPVTSIPETLIKANDGSAAEALREAAEKVRTEIAIVYQDGKKVAWKADMACFASNTGWRPWSSGAASIEDVVTFCGEMQSGLAADVKLDMHLAVKDGKIVVSEDLGKGDGWSLMRSMTCEMDGRPISTNLTGESITGNRKISSQTVRAFSPDDIVSAEKACAEAARKLL